MLNAFSAGDLMKMFIALSCFVMMSYAADKYEHIINAANNLPDVTEDQKKTFAQIQAVIYQRSSDEITSKQLLALTVPQLGLLIQEIKSRSVALQKLYKSKSKLDKHKVAYDILRLDKIHHVVISEYKKWHEKFVYDEKRQDYNHMYVYHKNYY